MNTQPHCIYVDRQTDRPVGNPSSLEPRLKPLMTGLVIRYVFVATAPFISSYIHNVSKWLTLRNERVVHVCMLRAWKKLSVKRQTSLKG